MLNFCGIEKQRPGVFRISNTDIYKKRIGRSIDIKNAPSFYLEFIRSLLSSRKGFVKER